MGSAPYIGVVDGVHIMQGEGEILEVAMTWPVPQLLWAVLFFFSSRGGLLLSKTEAQSSNEEEDEASIVIVELVVVHDGVTDLPSAGEHMKHCIDSQRCRIPVDGGGSLKPAPRSMKVQHKFAATIATTERPYAEPVLLGNVCSLCNDLV